MEGYQLLRFSVTRTHQRVRTHALQTHAAARGGPEKVGNVGAQAVTVNINGDSSCGINVAHLGGQSREETAARRGSDEEEIQADRQERRRGGGRDGGGMFGLTFNKPLPSVSLNASLLY